MAKTTFLVFIGIALVGGTFFLTNLFTASSYTDTIGQLRSQIEGSQREVSELRKLNADSISRLNDAQGIIGASQAELDRLRGQLSQSRGLVKESLGDVDYIRATIKGLAVLGSH